MNLSAYVFGKFPNGYAQYPDDYTKDIFSKFYENSQAKTQIAMHRDKDLMYYGYIRMLEDDCYIGLCAVVNGHYVSDIHPLFSVFEKAIEMMVRNGYLIHYSEQGEIVSDTTYLADDKEALNEISRTLVSLFNQLPYQQLPSVDYSKTSLSVKSYSVQDDENEIITSSYTEGFTLLYKSKGFDTASMLGYKGVIARLNKQIVSLREQQEELEQEKQDLNNQLVAQKLKQRNMTWVGILAIVVLILGVVVWNRVLFPDEVTKYDAGDFLYYGPIENGKPNGTGVAIYPNNDKYGRLYYYGNFVNGDRVDKNAIMFYRDGSYFKGTMNNDNWFKGVFYDVENEHFVGEFKNNQPYKGTWYKHVPVQTLK